MIEIRQPLRPAGLQEISYDHVPWPLARAAIAAVAILVYGTVASRMIPKSGNRFSDKIMRNWIKC